jgi:hypothetical protein
VSRFFCSEFTVKRSMAKQTQRASILGHESQGRVCGKVEDMVNSQPFAHLPTFLTRKSVSFVDRCSPLFENHRLPISSRRIRRSSPIPVLISGQFTSTFPATGTAQPIGLRADSFTAKQACKYSIARSFIARRPAHVSLSQFLHMLRTSMIGIPWRRLPCTAMRRAEKGKIVVFEPEINCSGGDPIFRSDSRRSILFDVMKAVKFFLRGSWHMSILAPNVCIATNTWQRVAIATW